MERKIDLLSAKWKDSLGARVRMAHSRGRAMTAENWLSANGRVFDS